MKILCEQSIEDEIIATNEMYHELYFHHDELCEKFIRKTGIRVTGFDEETINYWFEIIKERIKILRREEYNENTKAELVEIAAFLGNQLIKFLGGEWEHYVSKEHESCIVIGCKTLNGGENVLNILIGGYINDDLNWRKEIFLDRYRNRII